MLVKSCKVSSNAVIILCLRINHASLFLGENMEFINSDQNIGDFLQFVALKKRELGSWRFFHAFIHDVDNKIESVINEEFEFDKSWLLNMPKSNEILLFCHKNSKDTLIKMDDLVFKNFSNGAVRGKIDSFTAKGMAEFSQIIEPHIQKENTQDMISFTRMCRPENCFFVLDDDPMILKQMEKILEGFGNVLMFQKAEAFFESYKKHAPDVLFLDIHLRPDKGNEILKVLNHTIDVHSHVVMISSDTNEHIVRDIKDGGAKGFVVKPLDKGVVYQQISKAQTVRMKA